MYCDRERGGLVLHADVGSAETVATRLGQRSYASPSSTEPTLLSSTIQSVTQPVAPLPLPA